MHDTHHAVHLERNQALSTKKNMQSRGREARGEPYKKTERDAHGAGNKEWGGVVRMFPYILGNFLSLRLSVW